MSSEEEKETIIGEDMEEDMEEIIGTMTGLEIGSLKDMEIGTETDMPPIIPILTDLMIDTEGKTAEALEDIKLE